MAVKSGIGGWLLLYVIWAVWSICFAIYANGSDLVYYMDNQPRLEAAGWTVFILVLVYSAIYAWLLLSLCRKRPGIIARIKWMIIISPIFNACLPAIFALVVSFSLPSGIFGQLIKSAYPPSIIGSICGAGVMALAWHRYFSVSRRVAATWPQG